MNLWQTQEFVWIFWDLFVLLGARPTQVWRLPRSLFWSFHFIIYFLIMQMFGFSRHLSTCDKCLKLKIRGNDRKWEEKEEMEREEISLSPIPLSLFSSSFSLHFLILSPFSLHFLINSISLQPRCQAVAGCDSLLGATCDMWIPKKDNLLPSLFLSINSNKSFANLGNYRIICGWLSESYHRCKIWKIFGRLWDCIH